MLMIEHHPHRPLTQLGRVSPMSWHNSILPKERSLHKTRGDSGCCSEGVYPSGVLDAIEVFCSLLSDEEKVAFPEDINRVFYEEESPWRLLDESVVKLDPSMVEAGSIDHTVETLRTIGLDGALEGFRDALDELTGGDPRDAIQDACNAYESVLQFVTDTGGSATQLINEFRRLYLTDLPMHNRTR